MIKEGLTPKFLDFVPKFFIKPYIFEYKYL